MPSTSLQTYAAWSNYHLTLGETPEYGLPPAMTIEHMRHTHCADVDDGNPIETMRNTAAMLAKALRLTQSDTESRWREKRPREELAAGIVGKGWSFSPVIGTEFAQIMAEGLSWISEIPNGDRHKNSGEMNLCLCGGGTRLRELVNWAETRKPAMSIKTSGTHLGPTIAGTFGTASHGSRLNHGGFQDLVRGMHIITSDHRQVWLQKRGEEVLNENAIKSLKTSYVFMRQGKEEDCCRPVPDFAEVEIVEICEEEDFENALIHLGCMGVVNAVAIELNPVEDFLVMAWKQKIDGAFLDRVSQGDFSGIAQDCFAAKGRKPKFYELTIDPQKPFDEEAAHLFYFEKETDEKALTIQGSKPSPADSISFLAAKGLRTFDKEDDWSKVLEQPDSEDSTGDPYLDFALMKLLCGKTSLFDAYRCSAGFKEPNPKEFDPTDALVTGSWGQIHGDEISGGIPGSLYNASYAIDRKNVRVAIDSITQAVSSLHPCFVFTVRFVDDPAGNLAFTRFGKNAVIEIDGLSPHICEQTIYYARKFAKFPKELEEAFVKLSKTLVAGEAAVRQALEDSGIDYSMHWAKLGIIEQKKVLKDFGQPKGNSPIDSWQKTRAKLIDSDYWSDVFFRNPAATSYGLLPDFPQH